jgi:hypothetical protein
MQLDIKCGQVSDKMLLYCPRGPYGVAHDSKVGRWFGYDVYVPSQSPPLTFSSLTCIRGRRLVLNIQGCPGNASPKPRGPPWWVGQSAKKDWGQIYFFDIFYRVFDVILSRNTQKREKTNSRKSRFWIFGRTSCKNFSTRFFLQNVFCSAFELPSLKNTQQRDKPKQKSRKH